MGGSVISEAVTGLRLKNPPIVLRMARGAASRSSRAVAIALFCGGALLNWGGAFTGAPLRNVRQSNVARAGAAKDGPFTPAVVGLKVLMGEENLVSFRNAMIKL